MTFALAIAVGFLLDQLIGDPPGWPHPVRWLGRLIQLLEPVLRKLRADRLAGMLLVLIVAAITGFSVWGLLQLAELLHPAATFGLTVALTYLGLATRSLTDHASDVLKPLEKGDLVTARERLARMVGRDTQNLDSEQLCRACIESVAENTTDGVVAPLFYAALGGPIGLWVYKAVNTLDSMVGYRNPRYLRFGWASARLDDLASFIPARITLLLMPLAALLTGQSGWQALRIGWRDGRKHPSPNAGLAEAAMAGALGVQLGGPSTYGGSVSGKPLLGEQREPLQPMTIKKAVTVMRVTAGLMLLVVVIVAAACGLAAR